MSASIDRLKVLGILTLTLLLACRQAPDAQRIIVLMVDGVRYSESLGDSLGQYVPYLKDSLGQRGKVIEQMYSDGPTLTLAGHTAVMTGRYQTIANDGSESPDAPSWMHRYRKKYARAADDCWLITSKQKLHALSTTKEAGWEDYAPSMSCGTADIGRGLSNRADSVTMQRVYEVLDTHQPHLMLINLMEPDIYGHAADWDNYVDAIARCDRYLYELQTYLDAHDTYAGSTLLIMTNDHGRHLDGHLDGFVSHGDDCEGCRRLTAYVSAGQELPTSLAKDSMDLVQMGKSIAKVLGFDR